MDVAVLQRFKIFGLFYLLCTALPLFDLSFPVLCSQPVWKTEKVTLLCFVEKDQDEELVEFLCFWEFVELVALAVAS